MFKGDILCVDYRRLLIRITVKLLIDNIMENLATEHCFDIVGDKVVDFAVGSKPGEVYYLRNNKGDRSNSFEVWSLHNRIDVDLYARLTSEFKNAILTAVAASKAGVVVAGNGYLEQKSDKKSRIKFEHKLLMIVCLLCRRGKAYRHTNFRYGQRDKQLLARRRQSHKDRQSRDRIVTTVSPHDILCYS